MKRGEISHSFGCDACQLVVPTDVPVDDSVGTMIDETVNVRADLAVPAEVPVDEYVGTMIDETEVVRADLAVPAEVPFDLVIPTQT